MMVLVFKLILNTSMACKYLLAQADSARRFTTRDRQEVFFWLVAIVAVGVLAGVGGYLIWRQVKKREEEGSKQEQGFSLSEMKRLYESGEISHDEYLNVRNRLVGNVDETSDQPDTTEHVISDSSNTSKGQNEPDTTDTKRATEPHDPIATNRQPAPPIAPLAIPPALPLPVEQQPAPRFLNIGRDDFGSITARTLDAFESRLELNLPKMYREFLIELNGGTPNPSHVHFLNDDLQASTQLRYLPGIHDGEDWARLPWYVEQYHHRVPIGYIPIGIDTLGSLFLMSVQGPMSGRVYFWDHNLEHAPPTFDNMSFVAANFTDFLDKLGEASPPNTTDSV
jgi:hypothetical protein